MTMQESTPVAEAAPEAVEAPAEPVAEAPVDTTPVEAPEAPEGTEPVDEVTEPAATEAPADPFADFGGKDEVEAAMRLWQATQTDDGLVSVFLEAGRNIGLSLDDMQKLFQAGAGEQAPEEEIDLDEPVTRRELMEEQQRREQAAIQKEAERIHAEARTAVDSTMAELGITKEADPDGKIRALVLTLGEKHFDQKNISAESAATAVRAGFSEYQALIEAQSQQYLKAKAEAAETVPQAPSGAGPTATPPEPEPQNVAEAARIVRRRLGLSSS